MPVSAEEYSTEDFYKASGADGLSAGDVLEENGISFEDPKSIISLTPSKVWKIIKEMAEDKIHAPLRLFLSVLTVIILTSLAESGGNTLKSRELSGIFGVICVLACVAVISVPVCECLDIVVQALSDGSEFMLGFVPVFSGIAAAGGHVTSASGYSFAVLGFSEVAISIAKDFFMPLLSMCISAAIVDSCCETVSLGGILNAAGKMVTWGLGLVMTIFTGLLSIQSVVGSSADSLAAKAAKYVISNSVPLVGSAASDAYSTVKGSLILLKNGVGGIGIAALAVMLLPSLLHTLMYKISFFLLGIVSEVFGTRKLMKLFKNINTVLSAALGILICFMLMFIVSTGIVMTICSDAM
ncbi:MAG: hypothetical protein ACI4JB_10390 [Porcipelethomonas sp.]